MIGLLPAAGSATRINGLPKFLLPTPDGYLLKRHIDAMRAAGCDRVLIGTNERTEPLLTQFAPEASVYRARHFETMSQTVLSGYELAHADAHYPFVQFGMPDTYIPPNTYDRLLRALYDGAQLAVAVFPAREGQHRRGGMCRLEGQRVVEVIDKPRETDLTWIWGALAWTDAFWACIAPDEPHVGYAIPRAIAGGLRVQAVPFEEAYFDCGTVGEYFDLIRYLDRVPA